MHCDTNLVSGHCKLFYFEMCLITIWSLMTVALHQIISFTINSTLCYRHAPDNRHFETAKRHNVRELRVYNILLLLNIKRLQDVCVCMYFHF